MLDLLKNILVVWLSFFTFIQIIDSVTTAYLTYESSKILLLLFELHKHSG